MENIAITDETIKKIAREVGSLMCLSSVVTDVKNGERINIDKTIMKISSQYNVNPKNLMEQFDDIKTVVNTAKNIKVYED